ncbi:MAG: Trk system potassium transporter TrkA [Methanimicrococcus sp.]|nr:Trk system potassium transporter TrkA [Methanimicrococcus sp.]
MKIVVIGAGKVGYNIAKVLSDKNDVFVIDKDAERVAHANELDVQALVGNGANVDILNELKPFDLFVAVTNNDEINMIACFTAKTITHGKAKTVARVNNPDYIKKPVSKKPEIGVDIMVCPELALASNIAEILSIPGAIDAEVLAEGRAEMIEFEIGEGNFLINQPLKELKLKQYCIICAILRQGEVIIPDGQSFLMAEDRIIVVCKAEDVGKAESLFSPKEKTSKKKHGEKILLIGCGAIGLYLANLIEKDPDFDLKIIEQCEDRCLEIVDLLPNSLILHGDATDIELLKEEGVGHCDAVVAVTESDEKNLLCGLMMKHFGAKKIIVRTSLPDYIPIFETVGVDIALNTQNATVTEVLRSTLNMPAEILRTLPQANAEILEYTVTEKSKILGMTLQNLDFHKDAIICMIVRGNEKIIPSGDMAILPNDRVFIFSKPEAHSKMNWLFK